MKRNVLIALFSILAVVLVLVCAIAIIPFTPFARDAYRLIGIIPSNGAVAITPQAAAAPAAHSTALPTLSAPSLATVSNETADALAKTIIPPRNLYQIVPRLRRDLALGTPAPTPIARTRRVGDKDQFFVTQNASTGKYRTVAATLQYVTDHAYAWVEDGMTFDAAALGKSTEFFETSVYPTNHKYFGVEKTGIDGDSHINILSTKFGDAAGYFSSEDFFPRNLVPFSNQRNIIYMNIEAVKPGSDGYNGDLAHEFQHLIHAYEAPFATGWIDEGMGDLAIKVNGFPVGGVLRTFAENPNTQLNTWANDPADTYAHYAASYLFFDYAASRFGPDFTRDVILAARDGVYGVQAVLNQRGAGISFENLFADWAAANYLNDPKIENGKFSYNNESFKITSEAKLSQYPRAATVQMHEYAAEYFSLTPAGSDVTVYFTGTTTTHLLPVDAHSGKWMWWSQRADLSNTSLTRAFDLSRVQGKATLNFWTWYDIEKNFDYGYAEVSTNGGTTWDILPGKNTTTDNPNGANYGDGLTGKAGTKDDKAPAVWVQEQMDLSAYAGKQILLRFEYITDDAFNAPSWAIDDIAIPEINFNDDGETGTNGWDAKGFIRTDNLLPQKYVVQLVEKGNATRVTQMKLDDLNRGTFTINGFGSDVTQAELIVTPFAPVTTEPTQFQYAILPK